MDGLRTTLLQTQAALAAAASSLKVRACIHVRVVVLAGQGSCLVVDTVCTVRSVPSGIGG